MVRARNPDSRLQMTDIDKRTIAGLLRGDDAAYMAVINALKHPVYRFALRLCRDSATAEDITQQTFLAVWQSIGSFRCRSKFSTWVFGIAYRQYLLLRRQGEHAVETVPLEEWHQSDRSDVSDMSDMVLQNAERERIRRAVYALPDPYREVVCLVYLEGFTCSEAAEVLDVPIGTVKSRINGALKILRERFGESEDPADEKRQPESSQA